MIAYVCTCAGEKLHVCTHDYVHYILHAHVTVYTTTHMYPPFCGKKIRKKELIPYELVNCRMYAHWREMGHEDIDNLVREDPDVVVALAQCGLLKFFQCPFMLAQPRLLNALVDYWHPDAEAFMLEG
jgi:hypothetical protein